MAFTLAQLHALGANPFGSAAGAVGSAVRNAQPVAPTPAGAAGAPTATTRGVQQLVNQQATARAATPDDQWAKALAKEKARIDAERARFVKEQDGKRVGLENQIAWARGEFEKAQEAWAQQQIFDAQKAANPNWRGPGSSPEESAKAKAAFEAASANLETARTGLQQFRDNYNQSIADFVDPLNRTYHSAEEAAKLLRFNTTKQAELDKKYESAKAGYAAAVTQADKDRAAYEMYKAQKAMHDQDSADRQADIDAGRYAVNPYQFMAQGAGINEIDELRKQVNAGNLRPNMRVPDALVAPKEVAAPKEFSWTTPVRETVAAPKIGEDVAKVLGYSEPTPVPAEEKPLPQVSTEDIDTSSVASAYESPAEKEEKPKPETDASGNPVAPQPTGAGTLQQTSSTAGGASPTQQTATQAATPAPALPAQPTGSVAGQGSNTGQTPETQTPPKTEEKPDPFTSDEEKKEEQDSVF